MSERLFGWGIVGTGAIAAQFTADLRLVPGARLAAVCSRDLAKAQAFGGRAVEAYASLDGFLASLEIDAVYVATPNSTHADTAVAALGAKKPVLVEKPLATGAKDAERIAVAATQAGRFAMEAMWTRFLPAVSFARTTIASGAPGPIHAVRADLSYARDEAGGGRFFEPALGGGAALDLGVYPLSVALLLFDARAARSGVDLRCEWFLSYQGFDAHLSCGFDRDGENRFAVEGERETLVIASPFLKAQRVTRLTGAARRNPLARGGFGGPSLANKALARLPWPGKRVDRFAFTGNGLQFEAQAAMKAIREG